MSETFDLLTVALLPGTSPRSVRALSARSPLGEALQRPDDHADLLPHAARQRLRSGEARREAESELARARSRGVRIAGWCESDYPRLLREAYDPPPVLYVLGTLAAEEEGVAVVGARAATPHGQTFTRRLAADLAAAGLTVVSGMARGIDTAAHRGALDARGRSVAVLGSSLDDLYPAENELLARELVRDGAVVSEFRFGTPARPGNFPRRNRVIAAWARGTLVVEAAEKSGALITARLALEEGREVMAVPGHPAWPTAAGTNQLIRDGAALVRNAADVLSELGLAAPAAGAKPAADRTDAVLGLLRTDSPSTLEEIESRSGRPIAELLSRLTELELSGQVRRLPGAQFVRT